MLKTSSERISFFYKSFTFSEHFFGVLWVVGSFGTFFPIYTRFNHFFDILKRSNYVKPFFIHYNLSRHHKCHLLKMLKQKKAASLPTWGNLRCSDDATLFIQGLQMNKTKHKTKKRIFGLKNHIDKEQLTSLRVVLDAISENNWLCISMTHEFPTQFIKIFYNLLYSYFDKCQVRNSNLYHPEVV